MNRIWLFVLFLLRQIPANAQEKGFFIGTELTPGITANQNASGTPGIGGALDIGLLGGYMTDNHYGLYTGLHYHAYVYGLNETKSLLPGTQTVYYAEIPLALRGTFHYNTKTSVYINFGLMFCIRTYAKFDAHSESASGYYVTGENTGDFVLTVPKPFIDMGFNRKLNDNTYLIAGWHFSSALNDIHRTNELQVGNNTFTMTELALKLGIQFVLKKKAGGGSHLAR